MKLLSFLIVLILLINSFNNINCKRHHKSSLNKGLKYFRNHDVNQELLDIKNGFTNNDQPEAQYFTQQVDHFDPINTETFKQLYYVNDTYWDPNGGPIFILLGGESGIVPSYIQGHFILNTYAEKFNALIIAIEHRGYGQSMPFTSFDTYHLKYITVEQALADYAVFRQHIVEQYQAHNSKWVSFGGSYSGALSAWMRLKYPSLIDAAIASSAPVQATLDFSAYFDVVSNSLGAECSALIQSVTDQVTEMIQNGSIKQVEEMFQACDPIETPLDIATFMESLSGGPAEIVQYNNDNKATFSNISTMCQQIGANGNSPLSVLTAFAKFNQNFNTYSGSNCTTSSYQSYIESMQNISLSSPNAASLVWTYQTCTYFGYFQTAESSSQPFSSTITLDYFVQMCTDIFGPKGYVYQPQVQWILTEYGGQNNLQASQLVMANGAIDPWHMLGVLNSTNDSIQTILIPTTAHCADLYAPTDNDPSGLIQARQYAIELISKII